MAYRHIKKLAELAGVEVVKAGEITLKIATALSIDDYTAETIAGFMKSKEPVETAIQNLDASLSLWRSGNILKEINNYLSEIKTYDNVLESLKNDKSPNREEVEDNITRARIQTQKLVDYLLLVQQVGNLPNKKKNYNKWVRRNSTFEEVTEKLIQPIIDNTELIKIFMREEIEWN